MAASKHRVNLQPQLFSEAVLSTKAEELLRQQNAFGYTAEDVDMIIQDMAAQGKEPTYCMGDDIPLAVLSDKPHLLYDYFKQRFAQVTNPAIDPLTGAVGDVPGDSAWPPGQPAGRKAGICPVAAHGKSCHQ
jgi:hypothetical protein